MPSGHLQSADTRFAPARSEIVEIHAASIGRIEKRPQPAGAEWRTEAEVVERLEQIRESFVAIRAWRHGNPQGVPAPRRTAAIKGAPSQRSRANTVASFGTANTGTSSAFSQMIGQLRRMPIDDASHHHALAGWMEAQRFSQFRFAFENDKRPTFDPPDPLLAARKYLQASRTRRESDRRQDLRPRPRVITGDVV